MVTALIILSILFLGALLLVSSVYPNQPSLSPFEIDRRRKSGDNTLELEYLRQALHQDVLSVQRIVVATLLVLFVLTSIGAFGWFWGFLISVAVALEHGAAARIEFIQSYGQRLYDSWERQILEILEKYQSITKWVRFAMPASREERVTSKAELEELVAKSQRVLSENEKKLILSSLKFETKIVRDVMTPKSVVETIAQHEMLGPLVLDDLHKTGHSRFPVINGDIDHVVGILHLRDVLTVDSSKHHTARVESAMSRKVFYIRDDHTLSQALSAFLRTHHHLFIVINEFRETVGILTLEDTLEVLLGRRIIDEFDAHDDMRAVASRQAALRSNQPAESTEV